MGGKTTPQRGPHFLSNDTTFRAYRGCGRSFFPSQPQVSPLALNIQPLSGLVNNHFVVHSIAKRYTHLASEMVGFANALPTLLLTIFYGCITIKVEPGAILKILTFLQLTMITYRDDSRFKFNNYYDH